MSQSNEPSYYEIALTNRQVLGVIKKHLPDPDAIDWNATLDALSEELDWDL